MSVSSSSSSSSSPSGVHAELASAGSLHLRCLNFLHRRRKKLEGFLAHDAIEKEAEEFEERDEVGKYE